MNPDFVVPIFGVGNTKDCMFSWCCCPFALAQSRTTLDGSPFCFNVFCLNPVAARWTIRTAYGLRGEALDDTVKSVFFPCCSVNQLYQTTQSYGNPAKFGGRLYNQELFRGDVTKKDCCYNCLFATFCTPCAVGSVMDTTMGMPWMMACCCVNPFLARNLMRYHWRMKGDDTMEMVTPLVCCTIDQFVFLDPYGVISLYGIGAMLVTMQLLGEVDARGGDTTLEAKRYLTGYSMDGILGESEDATEGDAVQYEDMVGRSLMEVEAVEINNKRLSPPTGSEIINGSMMVTEQQKRG